MDLLIGHNHVHPRHRNQRVQPRCRHAAGESKDVLVPVFDRELSTFDLVQDRILLQGNRILDARHATGQVSAVDVAYLTDRVLVNEGKPQEYGTQFHVVDGVRQPRPIREPGKVDERRAARG